MKKIVLALGFLAVAAPALAQMPGGIAPVITPAIVNTTQPPVPQPTPPAEAPKN
jgi:hypothetical protein